MLSYVNRSEVIVAAHSGLKGSWYFMYYNAATGFQEKELKPTEVVRGDQARQATSRFL